MGRKKLEKQNIEDMFFISQINLCGFKDCRLFFDDIPIKHSAIKFAS